MGDLPQDAKEFLGHTDWARASVSSVAGDASSRQYFRLTRKDETAILMRDPPGTHHGTRRFTKIARHLRDCGLCAPAILVEDHDSGFLLLEDLGEAVFADIIRNGSADETQLYLPATDALVTLHAHAAPAGLEVFTPEVMTEQAALVLDWYAPGDSQYAMLDALKAALSRFAPETSVMIHRDFHAENLLWQTGNSGVMRVGLIDFQDAMIGHPAYDLASLVLDARRDTAPGLEQTLIQHYCSQTGSDPVAFTAAFHALGVQRNLRILGVFARLAKRDAKPRYLEFVPRVWNHIETSLAHPELTDLAKEVRHAIPAPDPTLIRSLRSQ